MGARRTGLVLYAPAAEYELCTHVTDHGCRARPGFGVARGLQDAAALWTSVSTCPLLIYTSQDAAALYRMLTRFNFAYQLRGNRLHQLRRRPASVRTIPRQTRHVRPARSGRAQRTRIRHTRHAISLSRMHKQPALGSRRNGTAIPRKHPDSMLYVLARGVRDSERSAHRQDGRDVHTQGRAPSRRGSLAGRPRHTRDHRKSLRNAIERRPCLGYIWPNVSLADHSRRGQVASCSTAACNMRCWPWVPYRANQHV